MRHRYTLLGLAVIGFIACGAARAGAPAAGPTNMTQLARPFRRHNSWLYDRVSPAIRDGAKAFGDHDIMGTFDERIGVRETGWP